MGPKKKPKTIKSNLFAGSSPLTVDDLSRLQVDSFGPQAAVLLDDLNWSQEVIALTGFLEPGVSNFTNSFHPGFFYFLFPQRFPLLRVPRFVLFQVFLQTGGNYPL